MSKQGVTTANWNAFYESLSLRRAKLVELINSCKDEVSLNILRKDLQKLSEESEEYRKSFWIND